MINAFDPSTGAFRGTLTDATGQTIVNPGLWTLTFGNGVTGDANTLYFTAGIDGEKEGLFGSIQAVPPLSSKAPIVPNLPNGAFQTLTTVPANGDLNPYGVAFVPPGFPTGGTLSPGDILVSNFNNSANQQGTGTTIVDITPNGGESTFFQGPSTPGLDDRPGRPEERLRDRRQRPGDLRQQGQAGVHRPGISPDPRSQRQRRHHDQRFHSSSTVRGT